MPLVPLDKTDTPVEPPARTYAVTGEHAARCKREEHPDWMHSFTGCAVGSDKDHCDCTAHYVEVRF